jgi:hypothetical protein
MHAFRLTEETFRAPDVILKLKYDCEDQICNGDPKVVPCENDFGSELTLSPRAHGQTFLDHVDYSESQYLALKEFNVEHHCKVRICELVDQQEVHLACNFSSLRGLTFT